MVVEQVSKKLEHTEHKNQKTTKEHKTCETRLISIFEAVLTAAIDNFVMVQNCGGVQTQCMQTHCDKPNWS